MYIPDQKPTYVGNSSTVVPTITYNASQRVVAPEVSSVPPSDYSPGVGYTSPISDNVSEASNTSGGGNFLGNMFSSLFAIPNELIKSVVGSTSQLSPLLNTLDASSANIILDRLLSKRDKAAPTQATTPNVLPSVITPTNVILAASLFVIVILLVKK